MNMAISGPRSPNRMGRVRPLDREPVWLCPPASMGSTYQKIAKVNTILEKPKNASYTLHSRHPSLSLVAAGRQSDSMAQGLC